MPRDLHRETRLFFLSFPSSSLFFSFSSFHALLLLLFFSPLLRPFFFFYVRGIGDSGWLHGDRLSRGCRIYRVDASFEFFAEDRV